MDVLDEILSSLRLTGGVVIDGEFSGDFCVVAQFTPDHFAPFFPTPDKLISYHYVRSGQLIVEVDGMAAGHSRARATIVDPAAQRPAQAGEPDRACRRPMPSEISWVTADGVHRVSTGTEGPKTEVWCGFLGDGEDSAHPLLDACRRS